MNITMFSILRGIKLYKYKYYIHTDIYDYINKIDRIACIYYIFVLFTIYIKFLIVQYTLKPCLKYFKNIFK